MIKTRLARICSLNCAIALVLFVLQPAASELKVIYFICRGYVLNDSSRYIQGAWDVVLARQPLYPYLFFERGFKYIYPTSALLIGSAAHLLHASIQSLVQVLVICSIPATFFFAGESFLLVAAQESDTRKDRWQIRSIVAALGFLFYPLVTGVLHGQLQTMISMAFTISVWCWITGRRATAGVCLALACAIKPQLAIYVVWAIFRRQWRFLKGFGVTLLAVQVVAGFLFGWSNEFGYLAVLNYLSHHGEAIYENHSMNGLLERWVGAGVVRYWTDTSPYPPYNPIVYFGTMLTSAALLLFGLLSPILRRYQASTSDFILLGLAATMASPIVWIHHYGLFYIACIYFFAMRLRQSVHVPYSFLAAFLVMANLWTVRTGRPGSLSVVLFTYDFFAGCAILIWMSLLEGKSAASVSI